MSSPLLERVRFALAEMHWLDIDRWLNVALVAPRFDDFVEKAQVC